MEKICIARVGSYVLAGVEIGEMPDFFQSRNKVL
jgi:hypothetical protein